ncbi:MAG: gluconeogenesis factor YvcK family protein [Bacillota bacterium]
MKLFKWLYPGIKLKRWIFLILLGLFLINIGILLVFDNWLYSFFQFNIDTWVETIGLSRNYIMNFFGSLYLVGGIVVLIYSIKGIISRLSRENEKLVDDLYQEEVLQKGPKVVALGGGTGLSNLLRGLKLKTSNITAIVTVADDGGSSGKLREELDMPPPGDIRNCLVALADTEPLMEELFQYRFSNEGHLVGHSFGNLFIASMNEVLHDFEAAVKESSKVLAIRGQVLPASNENVRLGAVYKDKTRQLGESLIPDKGKEIDKVFLEPKNCRPSQGAIEAIEEAELIILGPGSLYTSLLPNLLIKEIEQAIRKSEATKVFICNVMTQPGETSNFTASDHLQTVYDHIGEGLFDWIVVNQESIEGTSVQRYQEEGAFPVVVDREKISQLDIKLKEEDLLREDQTTSYLRHDAKKLAKVVLNLLNE